jgi:endonuclease-8
MPEGDTVWLSARRMHAALAGRILTTSDLRVPALATADLTGRQVLEVVARGKHMLTRVEGGLSLHTHFRMDGSWRLFPAGKPWHGGPDWQVRAVLANAEWQAVGYRLPVVDLVDTAEEDRIVGHLGPDLLGPDWDTAEAVRRLLANPARAAGEALLDQRNLAGIGNVYKAETLFLRGIHPWQPIGDVTDLAGLAELARRMLEANKDRVDRVLTGNPARGAQTWVYGRAGRPCRRCGELIRRADQGPILEERITFWCPRCQPPVESRASPQQASDA